MNASKFKYKMESRDTTSARQFKKLKPLLIIVAVISLATLLWSFLTSSSSVLTYTFPKVFSQQGIKSTDDRVNVLLLGNGGGKHDGASLTDSIIVASYNLKTNKAVMISIPRDLWVEDAKAKINTIYQTGQFKNGGDGIAYAKEKIGQLVGLDIHYGIRLDFNGFAKAIDLVEGVDVDVPKTFDDYNYPIDGKENDLCGLREKEVDLTEEQIKALNLKPEQAMQYKVGKNKVLVDLQEKIATGEADFSCRFEHIHYDKGITHLDGTSALKFVRSRHGTNNEGTDFARSRRQQLVIQGFREKALSLDTLVNPQKVTGLFGTLGDSVQTDIPLSLFPDFYKLAKKMTTSESVVLGDLGKGKSLLVIPPPVEYGGAFVLIPQDKDFSKIQSFVKENLLKNDQEAAQAKQ